MLDLDDWTPAKFIQLESEVAAGEADPSDVEEAVTVIPELIDTGIAVPQEAMRLISRIFRASGNRRRSRDAGFRLARKVGRPKASPRKRADMAVEVLRWRLTDMPHQEVLEEVSENCGAAITIVGEAWADCGAEAFTMLRLENDRPWTPEELERLPEIFANQPWFTAPGNSRELSGVKPA